MTADNLHITTMWKRGYEEKSDPPVDVGRTWTGSAVDHQNFSDASAHFTYNQTIPELLAVPDSQGLTGALGGSGQQTFRSVQDKRVVAVEESPNSVRSQGAPLVGFWHTVEGPAVAYQGLDTATIEGNFTLFFNNVTIDVTDSEQGTYQNWTGYRSWDPSTPAGTVPNPAIQRYEVRVSTIDVTHGTLVLEAPGDLDYYADAMDVHIDGVLASPAVNGQLSTEDTLFSYTGTPLQMEGSGVLALTAAGGGAGGLAAQSHTDRGTSLSLAPVGSFSVAETPGVETAQIAPSDPWTRLVDEPWLAGLALLLPLGAVAAVVAGRSRRHRSPGVDKAQVGSYPDRVDYKVRIEEARGLYNALNYAEALEVLESLVIDAPYAATPWYLMGRIHQAYGNHEQALQAYERLRSVENAALSHDALYHMAQAAWTTGDREQASASLLDLAHGDPARAVDLIQEPGFNELGWYALDELPLQVVDLWTETEWNRQRFDHAQRLLAHLLRAGPERAVTYLRDRHFDALVQRATDELGPPELASLVHAAWDAGRISIATTALIHLARQAPAQALELCKDPELSLLRDDLRVHRLLAPVADGTDA